VASPLPGCCVPFFGTAPDVSIQVKPDRQRINHHPLVCKPSRLTGVWLKPVAKVPEGRCDRSLTRVPGTAPPQKSRPVGYGVIRAGVRTDSMIGLTQGYGAFTIGISQVQETVHHIEQELETSSDTNLSRRVFSLP